jgi:hypothetical protein
MGELNTSGRGSFASTVSKARRATEKYFVPILYQKPAFDASGDFNDFLESIICEHSESRQVRGSNPCRGPNNFQRYATMLDFGKRLLE